MFLKSIGLSLFISALALQTPSSEYGPKVGDKAPDFTLSDSKGNTYRLSDYKGDKVVVIEFFRSGGW
jgi:peroxiredoxin